MTPKTLALLLVVAMAFAPLAAAEYNEDGDNECPPDKYCTMSNDGEAPSEEEGGNSSDGNRTRGKRDNETASGDDRDEPASNEDDEDNNAWKEDCPPDRMCAFNEGAGDGDQSASGEPESDKPDATAEVPAPGFAALLAAFGAVAGLGITRRGRR